MKNRSIRRAAIAALAVFSLTWAAACSSAARPPPAPVAPSVAASSPTAEPTAPTVPTAPQATPPSAAPAGQPVPASRPRGCLGAVVYPFDPGTSGSWPAPCIGLGGVLRIQPQGPEGVSFEPVSKASCGYEAAVHECRLTGTGTIRFSITRSEVTRVLTVTVASTSPPAASPACQQSGTYALDASDIGPAWWAICLRSRVDLRINNLGPDGLSASPDGILSCRYEAGVRTCRFLKAGTVVLKITTPYEPRLLTIVVIR